MVNLQQIKANGFTFDVRTSGQASQQAIFFLHGFPETSHMWVRLMEELGQLGYFCVAPNQRGYSLGAQPKGKKNYAMKHLVADIYQLAQAFDIKRFHLVGHDWGAIIGWAFAQQFPRHLFSWTALSVPHPQAFGEALTNDPEQAKMSAYIKRFQIPWFPERKIR
ncbi:MAG: alpha/beta fold hydrolase, partial [Bacteroidota bacterium]